MSSHNSDTLAMKLITILLALRWQRVLMETAWTLPASLRLSKLSLCSRMSSVCIQSDSPVSVLLDKVPPAGQ
jgi:hypothetical protein